jgi:transposase InsO family protein
VRRNEEQTDDKLEYIKTKQLADKFCHEMIHFITQHELPEDPEDAKTVILTSFNFSIVNGLLYYTGTPKNRDIADLLVIPKTMVAEILHAFHDDIFAGHLGLKRTYAKIKQRYFWHNMYADIKLHCDTCVSCHTRKSPHETPKAPLVSIPVGGPFDRVATDIMGPLPLTEAGNKYIIVFTDYLTKFCMTSPLRDVTAESTARVFLSEVILRHGAPVELLSDQGKNFTSKLIDEVCKLCDTRKSNTSPYHPQTDGLVERFNKTLATMISMYVNKKQNDWDIFLPFVTFAYNTCKHESTKYTPFFLMYGREPRLPI